MFPVSMDSPTNFSRKQEKWNDHTDSKLILSAGSCVAGSSLGQSCESVFTISVFSIFFIFFVFVISSGLCEFFNLPSPSPFSPPYSHSVYFAFSLRRRLYHRLPRPLRLGVRLGLRRRLYHHLPRRLSPVSVRVPCPVSVTVSVPCPPRSLSPLHRRPSPVSV